MHVKQLLFAVVLIASAQFVKSEFSVMNHTDAEKSVEIVPLKRHPNISDKPQELRDQLALGKSHHYTIPAKSSVKFNLPQHCALVLCVVKASMDKTSQSTKITKNGTLHAIRDCDKQEGSRDANQCGIVIHKPIQAQSSSENSNRTDFEKELNTEQGFGVICLAKRLLKKIMSHGDLPQEIHEQESRLVPFYTKKDSSPGRVAQEECLVMVETLETFDDGSAHEVIFTRGTKEVNSQQVSVSIDENVRTETIEENRQTSTWTDIRFSRKIAKP